MSDTITIIIEAISALFILGIGGVIALKMAAQTGALSGATMISTMILAGIGVIIAAAGKILS